MFLSTKLPFMETHLQHQSLIAGALSSLGEYIVAGGFFMILLFLCSLLTVGIIVFKFLQLQRARIIPSKLEKILQQISLENQASNLDSLSTVLRKNSSLGEITKEALAPHNSANEARDAAETEARSQFNKLETGIPLLETIVTIAPLLGLLGTVAGLVSVFSVLGQAQGDAPEHAQLAKGIAQALGTTIAGLVVAIPAIIANSYFISLLQKYAVRIEQLTGRLISSLYRKES